METRYVLGVDGGATKTDMFLLDTAGNIAAYERCGCTNHEDFDDGMAGAERELGAGIDALLRRAGTKRENIVSSVLGLAGCDTPTQYAQLDEVVGRLGLSCRRVFNDSFLGVKAGSPNGFGVCVVNGTGSSVGGIDPAGNWLQVGGGGHIFGDGGGAGQIVASAILRVYNELFRLGQPTALTPKFMELMGISDPRCIIEAVYRRVFSGEINPREFLDVIFLEANRGDAMAVEVLEEAGREMARSAAGCVMHLDFGGEVDVVLIGSVTQKATCPVMIDTLKVQMVALTGKKCNFIQLDIPPAAGAVLWALEICHGKPVDAETRSRVIASVKAKLL